MKLKRWQIVKCVGVPVILLLTACAPQSHQVVTPVDPVSTAIPATTVYFYPQRGQSPAQQDRDKYECYLWSVEQTGFDPSALSLAPHQRVMVVPRPAPGHDTAVGAVAGAMIGAVAGAPRNSAGGAVLGAIAGGMIGAASDASRQEQAAKVQKRYNQRSQDDFASLERRASEYRRAMGACLSGRGYSVQ